MKNLTTEQLSELKHIFCEKVVDNLDKESLSLFVYESILQSYEAMKEQDFRQDVIDYYDGNAKSYEQLVKQVASD
jgi:hypothetical protein